MEPANFCCPDDELSTHEESLMLKLGSLQELHFKLGAKLARIEREYSETEEELYQVKLQIDELTEELQK